MDFYGSLVEVSSHNSETVMHAIEKVIHEKDIIQCWVNIMVCKDKYGIMHPMQYT